MVEIEDDSHVYSNIVTVMGFYLNIARVMEFETTQQFACVKESLNEVNDEMELKDVKEL